ncbi:MULTISPECIES: hypothetical protein [Mycobacterium]|uniref:DNA polymerase IV/DNA polymerase iota-like thumb domain-containing protein n=4 Tax=Mycobacterium TaxID=1763 RepID=A0AAW5SCU3_MYCBC|nr:MULTISPECIES: hypothetical protein [Mycobacterium]MCV6992972.1 hypothetical protein [Mycobacterium bouchedurhonense]MCV6993181.1 hypothetical protein [Mycobacterium timonense]MDA3641950.1 hypothetical protein [Mycobacterium xenopi]MDA3659837.1 hypothetical protein [Mycobacterium xenopi]MDA3664382.1 hypothetical protein [Mycobacterium xenopi]
MTNAYAACQRLARRTLLLLTPLVYSVARAAPAWASGTGAAAALWLGVADSDGVPIEKYGLSLNNGSLTDPTAAPPALAMHWAYSLYLAIISVPLWMGRNVDSFGWLEIIGAPFDFLGQQLTAMVHSPAVVLTVGTIAAAAIGVTIAIGRFSRGVAMIVTAVLLAYLSVALGAKPLDALIGPSGLLTTGRDIGIEAAAELSGKPATGQAAVDAQSASLADNFIRIPTQEMNFGADIDAPPYNCGPTWSNAIEAGDIDKVKDAVATCPDGKRLHDYAMADPTSRKLLVVFALIFAVTVWVVFGVLSLLVVILALSTLFWFIVAIIALVTGWIPGDNQDLALKASLDGVFSFFGMIAFTAIKGITGNLTGAMFAQAQRVHATANPGGDAILVAMPIVTMLLIAMVVALWKIRRRLVAGRDRAVRAVQAFTGRTTNTATSNIAGVLDRLDPLTAIPNTAQRLTRLTAHTAKTAAKVGLSAAFPEAAPFLQAADTLQSRVHAHNLKNSRRAGLTTTTPTNQQPNTAPPAANRDQTTPPATATDTSSAPHRTGQPGRAEVSAPQPPSPAASDSWLNLMGDQSVDALTGIGPVTSSRLADLGITTVAQMARADQELLKSTFGPQQGRYLWLLANGGGVDVTTTTSATQQQASSASSSPQPATSTSNPAGGLERHIAAPNARGQTHHAEQPLARVQLHPAILAVARNDNPTITTAASDDALSRRILRPTNRP